jgi:DNA polymerase III delta' subunit
LEALKANQMENKLLAYLAGDRVHPSLILAGPGPQAKAKTARRMAKALLCPKRTSLPPFCGACSTCRRIEAGNHPDVIWVGSEEEDTIKIDRVRELCHQMELTPVEGEFKIAVIEDCHRMNTASANAFLKTLEEPAPGRFFWLLTDRVGSLLPTIVSRCLTFHFPPTLENAPSENAEWEKVLTDVVKSGDFNAFAQQLKDKDKCLDLVHYLQVQWRLKALHPYLEEQPAQVFQSASFWDALLLFDEAVQLEGRLRSNANPGLLLESHLRETLSELTKERP